MNYEQTLTFLLSRLPMYQRVGPVAYKANLDNTIALMDLLDHPHKKFRCIHIAGTNGKGSCSHMLAAVLQCCGYKVGLYTSPHLKDFRERIKINGTLIAKKYVVDFVNQYKNAFEKIQPSFFEWTVALAYDYFANQKVDIAVIEVGLGGRLDSTNVITPEISLITNIGWDHMDLLGDTLEKIAYEKAGIIKRGVPVVISEVQPETYPVFMKKALSEMAPIHFAPYSVKVTLLERTNKFQRLKILTDPWGEFEICLDLAGTYQQLNIRGVIKTLSLLTEKGYLVTSESIQKGLFRVKEMTGLLGRWQVLQERPLVIADTGHNKNGIQEVIENIRITPHKHLHVVFGMVKDKNPDNILALLPRDATYYFCKPDVPRGLSADELQKIAAAWGLQGNVYPSVRLGLAAAIAAANPDSDLVFVGGSTFVVAEVV